MNTTIKIRENKQLLRSLLTEAPLVASKVDEFPNFKPVKKWPTETANFERLLIALGGQPWPLPFSGVHAYEFKVGDDLIWVYNDKEAYSTNNALKMYAGVDKEFSPDGLTFFKTKELKQKQGAIERKNGRLVWKPVPEEEAEEKQSEDWVDYLQLGLSIVGLVPGWGDILDIVNAIISFIRYKWGEHAGDNWMLVDGFINLIGAMPVVGSVISLSVKSVFKGVKGGFQRVGDLFATALRQGKSADEIWIMLRDSGQLDARTLNQLANGMGDIAGVVKSFREKSRWALSDDAIRALDEFENFMRTNASGADEIFKAATKRADDVIQGGEDLTTLGRQMGRGKGLLKTRRDVDLGWDIIQKILPRGITNKLANTFTRTIKPAELSRLKAAMSARWIRKFDNPDQLAALIRSTPESRLFPGARWNTRDVRDFLRMAQGNPAYYNQLKRIAANDAMSKNNPLYVNFMNSEANAFAQFLSPESGMIKEMFQRWNNLLPVLWGDLKDMGEDVLITSGIETKDDVNGFFWPLLKTAIDKTETVLSDENEKPFTGKVKAFVSGSYETVDKSALGAFFTAPFKVAGLDIADSPVPYNPNIRFEIVPKDSPELKKQKEKEKEKSQSRSIFF